MNLHSSLILGTTIKTHAYVFKAESKVVSRAGILKLENPAYCNLLKTLTSRVSFWVYLWENEHRTLVINQIQEAVCL